MTKLLMVALAIAAALVALVPALTEAAGGYQDKDNQRERYEIAMDMNSIDANQAGPKPRPVEHEEPA
jgi:hypothetical protein